MRKHATEDLSELSVIGVDTGKDVFHLVGLMQRAIGRCGGRSNVLPWSLCHGVLSGWRRV